MKIIKTITVKKSTAIITILIAAALLILLAVNLFSDVDEPSAIPEWDDFYNIGVSNYKNGSFQSAATSFKIAIDIDGSRPEAYLYAADAYLQMNQLKKAKEILEIGIEATQNEALSLKYDELSAIPEPIEPEVLPPLDDEPPGDAGNEEEAPGEDLKISERSDVF